MPRFSFFVGCALLVEGGWKIGHSWIWAVGLICFGLALVLANSQPATEDRGEGRG